MLKITLHDYPKALTFKLEGQLAGAWVAELRQSWKTASSIRGSRRLVIDLTNVTYVDQEGVRLLEAFAHDQAEFLSSGPMMHAVVYKVTGGAQGAEEPVHAAPIRRGHRGSRFCLFSFFALVLAVLPAAAQVRLTLKEAVERTLHQNPQVLIANLNIAGSEQERRIARSALLPQAAFQADVIEQRGNIEAAFGQRIPGFPQHIGPWTTVQGGVGFTAPVLDLTLWRRYQASRAGMDAAAAERLGIREQAALLVVSQYLGAMRATADVRAAESRLELAQALYDLSFDLQKNGVGTGIDTLRSNVELQNEKQRLLAARTLLATTLNGLVRLLNLQPQQTVVLADGMAFFETPSFSAENSVESALLARPEMKVIAAQTHALELQRKAAGESRLPKVTVSGGWTEQGVSVTSAIPVYQYKAGVEVPLFTGGRIGAETARAEIALKRIAQQEQELRNRIALEVKNAVARLDSAHSQVDVANMGVKLAREEVTQARDRFQAGVANNIEVVTAQDELARANDNQILALYQYNQARADLAHATGQMETLYAR